MHDGLVIGTQDIAPKDQMVLRALVRLLEGGSSIHARFSEQLGECNVVFVPGCGTHRLPAPCVAVRVHDTAPAGDASAQASDLAVVAPLRMSNVMATLQVAAQRVHGVARVDPVRSLQALFTLLSESTRIAERRRAVVPLGCGQQIVFDFVNQLVHTATPLEVLFSGAYTVGTPHRVSPVEEELIRLEPSHSLRHVLWGLSLRLAQAGAAAPERLGRYQLRRWPDAVGLAAPGHPRLAALWTRSPLSLEQIRDVLYSSVQGDSIEVDRRWVNVLKREIQSAEVTLVAELAKADATVEQLLAMKPGDFIELDREPRIQASIGGVPIFECQYGTHNSKYAIRIEECLRNSDTSWLGEKNGN